MTFDLKFTPDMWAGIPSEEMNAHFNDQFYASHSTIFIFNTLYIAVTTFNYLNYP